jgi:hypothetical protein
MPGVLLQVSNDAPDVICQRKANLLPEQVVQVRSAQVDFPCKITCASSWSFIDGIANLPYPRVHMNQPRNE